MSEDQHLLPIPVPPKFDPDDGYAHIRAQVWVVAAAQAVVDRERATLNGMVNAVKAARGDMSPTEELDVWAKK